MFILQTNKQTTKILNSAHGQFLIWAQNHRLIMSITHWPVCHCTSLYVMYLPAVSLGLMIFTTWTFEEKHIFRLPHCSQSFLTARHLNEALATLWTQCACCLFLNMNSGLFKGKLLSHITWKWWPPCLSGHWFITICVLFSSFGQRSYQ